MSDPPSWYSQDRPPRPGPPPSRPPVPPPMPSNGGTWALPIALLVAVVATGITATGTYAGIESLRGWALMGFLISGGVGLAVVFERPDRSLPDKTRSALQTIRVAAGLVVAVVVAGLAFFVYMVIQALRDPNLE